MATAFREPAYIAVDLVVLTLRRDQLHVVLAKRASGHNTDAWALPSGFMAPDEATEDTAYRCLRDGIGIQKTQVVLEQLKSYSQPPKDPEARERIVDVGWMVLGAQLPDLAPNDETYSEVAWVPVDEALTLPLLPEHAQILRDGLERARGKLENTQLATAFLDTEFTMSDLRGVYEAVWGGRLEPANFHRKVLSVPGFVEATGTNRSGRGRPARLYRAGMANTIHPPLTRASVREGIGG